VIDEHQARLESFVSCRCCDQSRIGIDRAEDDRSSELSYVEPTIAGASPATIPSSAPVESPPDESREGSEEDRDDREESGNYEVHSLLLST
jgi:hypothetical protein